MKYITNIRQEKKKVGKYLAYMAIPFFVMFLGVVQASDSVASVFTSQTATASGSNGSTISVDNNLSYVNKGNNSSIIGNYFSGYYYDDFYGYFDMDWSTNQAENVRIVGSSSACGTSYGYKLGGYSYSPAFGFMDFDFNSSVYVYYCVGDSTLYGYAYSEDLGFQNFEGITFDIQTISDVDPVLPTGTGTFTNDDTDITEEPIDIDDIFPSGDNPDPGEAENSNFTPKTIQADIIELNADEESLFYIIK